MTLKEKIIKIVLEYKSIFPQEYEDCKRIVGEKRNNQINNTGSLLSQTDFIERPLLEYPENLFCMLQNNLTLPELNIFHSKEYSRWFGRTFNEFSLVKKI